MFVFFSIGLKQFEVSGEKTATDWDPLVNGLER